MMPMMIGNISTSILAGQLISRTGRYKMFPVAGTALVTAALFLLSRIGADASAAALIARLLLLGVGLGLVMQVLVLAVQNSVPYADLGAATSSAMLFRLVGGSVGTAVLGVVFANTYASNAGAAREAAITAAIRAGFVTGIGCRSGNRVAVTKPERRSRCPRSRSRRTRSSAAWRSSPIATSAAPTSKASRAGPVWI